VVSWRPVDANVSFTLSHCHCAADSICRIRYLTIQEAGANQRLWLTDWVRRIDLHICHHLTSEISQSGQKELRYQHQRLQFSLSKVLHVESPPKCIESRFAHISGMAKCLLVWNCRDRTLTYAAGNLNMLWRYASFHRDSLGLQSAESRYAIAVEPLLRGPFRSRTAKFRSFSRMIIDLMLFKWSEYLISGSISELQDRVRKI
jgi:hypothetical protein